jgi:tetratricopeptide (TPR) repeat protein
MTRAVWLSAFIAAVFGLHPLAVESVTWVAERKNVLSTFFAFLTIWAYFRYTQKPGFLRYLPAALAFAGGLLSKPMLVTLPFALILLDYWPIDRFKEARGLRWLWRAVVNKLPLLIMSAAMCVVTYRAQAVAGAMQDITSAPLGLRAGNAMVSYIKYIVQVFYPTSLAPLYPLYLNNPALWQVIASTVLLLIVTAAVILERRSRRFLVTGWFWYLGTLVPVIGLIQVGSQAMADRYMYLPGVGIYIIIAWLAGEATTKLRLPKVIPATAGVLIMVILLVMTWIQVGYWKDSAALCKRTLAVTKNNYIMHNNYGELLRNSGHLDEAIDHFKQALAIRPTCVEARENLGNALQEKGEDAEAAVEFEIVLRARPDNLKTRNSFGVAIAKLGKIDEAIEQFSQVLSADPYRLTALNNLYKIGADNGKLDKALDIILGLQAKAPKNYELYIKAGLIYGTLGKINAAIEQLETACRLTEDNEPEPLDFLSQAYAARKNMERAVEAAQMALNAATEQGKSELAGQIKKHLELYQQSASPNGGPVKTEK